MNTTKAIVLSLGFFVLSVFAAHSQCKPFIKKQCMPQLAPFTSDGQLNNATLRAGESAELELTFYSGQNYRLFICAQEALGLVHFKLMDLNRNILFNSESLKEHKNYWDFNIENTQQMIVEVSAASAGKNDIIPSGCVAIIVGFKDAKN